MKTPYLSLLIVLFSFFGNAQTIVKEYYDNGNLKSIETQVNGKANGPAKIYYESGELQLSTNFQTVEIDGKSIKLPVGETIGYFKDGTIGGQGSFSIADGKSIKEGQHKMYYENGNLKSLDSYKNGIKDGEKKEFYENGKKKLVASYSNGKETGLKLSYYQNGNLESQYENLPADQLSTYKEFFRNGELKK